MKKATAKKFEAHEEVTQVGQDAPRKQTNDGLEPAKIEVVDGPGWKAKAEALAFMEEPVTVMVHESTNENDNPVVETAVNNVRQFFLRGQEQVVKRKFVEALARAKRTTYTQRKFVDSQGFDSIENIPHTALQYPFDMIEDANPNGRAWLRKVLAEK